MKSLTIFTACVILVGCVQVGPKTLPVAPCPSPKPVQCPAPVKYEMSGIPLTVTMKIRGDKILECDEGCEQIIRQYAKAQQLLR